MFRSGVVVWEVGIRCGPPWTTVTTEPKDPTLIRPYHPFTSPEKIAPPSRFMIINMPEAQLG